MVRLCRAPNMSFTWNEESVMLLIQKYHENEVLWNPRHPDYRNRYIRADLIKTIAELFDTDAIEIERKLKNLSSHYFRERKKYEESKKSGSASDDEMGPKWFAFRALDFLRDKIKPIPSNETAFHTESKQAPGTSDSRKKNTQMDENFLPEAFNVLREIKKMATSIAPVRDEATVFGEYIASKIRKLDPVTTSTVQNLIQNIIYQAEMGAYSQMTSTVVSPDNLSFNPIATKTEPDSD